MVLYRSAKGESYDIVMKVHDPSTKRGCQYVFLDYKSMREVSINTNTVFDVKSCKGFAPNQFSNTLCLTSFFKELFT